MNSSIPIKKVLTSGLLVVTIHDLIKGFSLDLLAPILNVILPGDVKRPIKVFGVDLYVTRFIIRVLNVLIAVWFASYLNKRNYYNY